MRLSYKHWISFLLLALIVAACGTFPVWTTSASPAVRATATKDNHGLPINGATSDSTGAPIKQCIVINSEDLPKDSFSGHLVISNSDANRFNYLSIFTLDDNSIINLTETDEPSGFYAAVSPDHQWLAYEQWISNDLAHHWLVVTSLNSETKIKTPWKNEWRNIAYWVDANHLLLQTGTHFSIFDPFNNLEEKVYMDFSDLYTFERHWEGYLNVVMSPDRSRLIYPTQGEGINLVTFPDKKKITSVPYIYIDTTPKWSPDSKHFIFLAPKSFDPALSGATIVLGTPDGKFEHISLPFNTYDLYNFSWSPDSKYVAFWRNYDQKEAYLNIFDIERRVIIDTCVKSRMNWNFSSKENTPFWSSDGNELAFVIRGEDSPETIDLVVVNLKENIGIKIKGSYRPIGWLIK